MQKIYHKATGEEFVREPVDAREMLSSGRYQNEPPTEKEMAAAEEAFAAAEDVVVRKAAPKKSGK